MVLLGSDLGVLLRDSELMVVHDLVVLPAEFLVHVIEARLYRVFRHIRDDFLEREKLLPVDALPLVVNRV